MGQGKEEAANTESHQVQTAVVAYLATGGNETDGVVGPATNMPLGYNSTQESVHKYLLNPGLLQADYTILNGLITNAEVVSDSKWSGCGWNTTMGAWSC